MVNESLPAKMSKKMKKRTSKPKKDTGTLSLQHERFCLEYLIDGNGTRAYKAAYPRCKDSTARRNASNLLLTNTHIKQFLSRKRAQIAEEIEFDVKKALKRFIKIGDKADLANDLSNENRAIENATKIIGGYEKEKQDNMVQITIS